MMKNLIKNRTFHIIAFEALASFILTYGVSTSGKHYAPDIVVASALFLAIAQSGQITGGYVNPIVTIGMWVDNRHKKLALYLIGQFLGAFIGAFIAWLLLGTISPPFQKEWGTAQPYKFMLNQFFGSGIFVICVLTLTNKFTSYAIKSWQVYLSVPVALFLVRKMTGSTCLNPAVGFFLQTVAAWAKEDTTMFFRDVWTLIIPSILGGIVGGIFMKKFYEPLLLFIKYKDLADQQLEDVEEVDETFSKKRPLVDEDDDEQQEEKDQKVEQHKQEGKEQIENKGQQ